MPNTKDVKQRSSIHSGGSSMQTATPRSATPRSVTPRSSYSDGIDEEEWGDKLTLELGDIGNNNNNINNNSLSRNESGRESQQEDDRVAIKKGSLASRGDKECEMERLRREFAFAKEELRQSMMSPTTVSEAPPSKLGDSPLPDDASRPRSLFNDDKLTSSRGRSISSGIKGTKRNAFEDANANIVSAVGDVYKEMGLSPGSPSGASSSPGCRSRQGVSPGSTWEPDPGPQHCRDGGSRSPRTSPTPQLRKSQSFAHDYNDVARIRHDLQLVEHQLAAARLQAERAERQKRVLIDKLLEPSHVRRPRQNHQLTLGEHMQKTFKNSRLAPSSPNVAAAKIQAVYRGSLMRRDLQKLKADVQGSARRVDDAETRIDRMLALLGDETRSTSAKQPRAQRMQKKSASSAKPAPLSARARVGSDERKSAPSEDVAASPEITILSPSLQLTSKVELSVSGGQEINVANSQSRIRTLQSKQGGVPARARPELPSDVSLYPRVRRAASEASLQREDIDAPKRALKKKSLKPRSTTPRKEAEPPQSHSQHDAAAIEKLLSDTGPRPALKPHPYPQSASTSHSLEAYLPPPKPAKNPSRQVNSAIKKTPPRQANKQSSPSSPQRPKQLPPPPRKSSAVWSDDEDGGLDRTQPRSHVQQECSTLKAKSRPSPEPGRNRHGRASSHQNKANRYREHSRCPSLTSSESDREYLHVDRAKVLANRRKTSQAKRPPVIRAKHDFVVHSEMPSYAPPARHRLSVETDDRPAVKLEGRSKVHKERRSPIAGATPSEQSSQARPIARSNSQPSMIPRAKQKASASKAPLRETSAVPSPQVPPEGQVYMGFRNKDGCKEGFGIMRCKDGVIFNGQWKADKRHGHGTLFFAGGVFEGHWANGLAQGEGKVHHKCGDVFEGQYVDNKKCGHGLYRWKDGAVEEGQYIDNLKHGWHVLKREDEEWDMHYDKGVVVCARKRGMPLDPDDALPGAEKQSSLESCSKVFRASSDCMTASSTNQPKV